MTYIPRSSSGIPGATGPIPQQIRKKHTLRVLSLLASVIFFASIAGAIGVYFLNNSAQNRLAAARVALEQASSPDDARRMEEIGAFDTRLTIAQTLLDNHLAPSLVFARLETIVKDAVQFSSVTYEHDPEFEPRLEFSVNASELTPVALQRLELMGSTMFTGLTMNGITTEAVTLNEDGRAELDAANAALPVEARFSGTLDAAQFAYTGETPAPAQPPQPVETVETEAPVDVTE